MSFHSAPIYVFVVARPLIRWGFEKLVHTAYLGIRISGTADTLVDALGAIHDVRADLMVVDHDEYTQPVVLEQAAKLVPVLLLTGEGNMSNFFGDHVAAVVSKSDSPAMLLRAIEDACERSRGRCVRSPAFSRFDDAQSDPDQIRISRLTARERELIIALLCSDTEPGKVIAHRLCISEQTLRNHLSSIYGKLGVHSRLGLHSFAVRHGLDRMTQ
jgi:two-component system nitrate/nitrite response regulator NarL